MISRGGFGSPYGTVAINCQFVGVGQPPLQIGFVKVARYRAAYTNYFSEKIAILFNPGRPIGQLPAKNSKKSKKNKNQVAAIFTHFVAAGNQAHNPLWCGTPLTTTPHIQLCIL
jgi:hypothetical protein